MCSEWAEWVSPNGVTHIVPPTGPCATCGNGRHETARAKRDAVITANETAKQRERERNDREVLRRDRMRLADRMTKGS